MIRLTLVNDDHVDRIIDVKPSLLSRLMSPDRQAYHACQESGALPASQKVVQHRWAEVTLFQSLDS